MNVFRKEWLDQKDCNDDYISKWCQQAVESQVVRCIWCKTNLKFLSKGITAIKQHAQVLKHQENRKKVLQELIDKTNFPDDAI